MSGHIFFNSEYNVLICKQHQYAVSLRYLTRHFSTEHNISLSIRQSIQAYASQFTPMDASHLTYSTEIIAPIPYLKIINAYQCQYEACGKILGTVNTIKDHCRVKHDWKIKDGNKWVATQAQTFYQGNNQR